MAVVFLDFDGVCHSFGTSRGPFEKPCLDALVTALQGTHLVISSSWREQFPLEQLLAFLGPLACQVIGVTPVIDDASVKYCRFHEVRAWLRDSGHRGAWVALDDERGNYPAHAPLYLCNRRTGFTAADVAPFRALVALREHRFRR